MICNEPHLSGFKPFLNTETAEVLSVADFSDGVLSDLCTLPFVLVHI